MDDAARRPVGLLTSADVAGSTRIFAIDWSGAARGAARKIWVAEATDGGVVRLENGRDRDEIADLLIDEAGRDPDMVVGLDFAFSFPAAFLDKRGHASTEEVWEEVETHGEQWLSECPFPFWGKTGRRKPALGEALYRETELAIWRETGQLPASVFQIGGNAQAVGVGSLRGMPILRRLRRQGFSIWPFDRPDGPRVVEIWPRLFMGRLRKTDVEARRTFLAERLPQVRDAVRERALESHDALDALVSAAAMESHSGELEGLRRTSDPSRRLEGAIWRPTEPSGAS